MACQTGLTCLACAMIRARPRSAQMSSKRRMTDHDKIFESDDGFLFLTGGDHDVGAYLTGRKRPDAASVQIFFTNMHERARYCRDAGIDFSMWVFPDKLHALRGKLRSLGDFGSLYLSQYQTSPHWSAAAPVVYPLAPIDGQGACFLRTDTHYSDTGVIAITHAILQRLDPAAADVYRAGALAALTEGKPAAGDLGRKFDPPRKERLTVLPALKPVTIRTNGLQRNNGVLSLVDSPEAETDQTLMIFGDSFFRQLLPQLAWRFRRIVFCRSAFFHAELVHAVNPQVIMGGAAERYLAACQPDASRPHFFAIPLIGNRKMQPQDGFAELFQTFFDQSKLI